MPFQPLFSLPAVFASVSQGPYPRKKGCRCALSGLLISHGDPVYRIKFKTWNDADIYDVRVDEALKNPEFMRSVEYFERRMYPCSVMFYDSPNRMELFDPKWAAAERILRKHDLMRRVLETAPEKRLPLLFRYCFDMDMIQEELKKPEPERRPPLSAEQILEKFLDGLEKIRCGQKVTLEDTDWLWKALGTLVMSEVHLLLAERYAELPGELRVALACSDNHVFAGLAAAGGLLPDWEHIHSLVSKGRLSLKDMLALAEWGRGNPEGLKLLWKTHELFGILGFSAGGSLGFGEMLKNGHAGHLMFLFAAHPELAPMLASFNPKNPCSSRGILVESWSYQLPYMYRTSVFSALLAGDAAGAEERIALMREHVGYYYHGEPDGFINDTAKMAESYIRRQNSMISLPTVFASVSRCPYPRKSISRCALSGLPISHGDPVYRVKYKTWNDASIYDVLVDKAQENPDFMRSVEYFERRMYPCSLMFYDDLDNMKLFDPEWARDEAIIREHERMRSIVEAKPEDRASLMMRYCLFDLAEIKAKLRRKIPAGRPPLSAEQILEKFLDGLEKIRCGQKVTLEDTDWLWKALGTLVMSEVHLLLAERHAELPDELRVALACSDNHVFVRLAAAGGLLPDWEQIHGLVGKARLTLDDMLALAEWGRNNPDGLKLLWKTHELFGILGFSAGGPLGFGEMLENGHAGYLLFLFAAHPELAPMLASFNPENPYSSRGMLVESWSYQLPYVYRSGVFSALLAGDAAGAEAWVALMREHVGYYYHGKPDGFINDTAKMADKYIRKYLR